MIPIELPITEFHDDMKADDTIKDGMTDDVAESDEIDEGEEGIPWCLQNILFSLTTYPSSVSLLCSVHCSFYGFSCLKEGKAVFHESPTSFVKHVH